ncbi:MAG: M28 family peptidase [Planctomycetes bacterium]|nr:M28 family peptidase [Planctomycetota bacterium]
MPGKSHSGPLPPLTPAEATLRDDLRRDVEELAGRIGERNVPKYAALAEAADFLEASLARPGHRVARQSFPVAGRRCDNLEVQVTGAGRADEVVVVGGHYDSVLGCPGANDNGTGAAAVLALARAFAGRAAPRTLRLVEFVNEEPGYFQTEEMGSLVYARRCRAKGEKVVAMLSLETIGYYTDAPGSQSYPFPLNLLYPSVGNFIAFVGNVWCADSVREMVGSFRRHTRFPSEGAAPPAFLPGVGWSDHWSFWQCGYPGVMVTDTAPFRYPHYHTEQDTPDQVDYERTARVVAGLERVVAELTGLSPAEGA